MQRHERRNQEQGYRIQVSPQAAAFIGEHRRTGRRWSIAERVAHGPGPIGPGRVGAMALGRGITWFYPGPCK
jgi:hypothetical protein